MKAIIIRLPKKSLLATIIAYILLLIGILLIGGAIYGIYTMYAHPQLLPNGGEGSVYAFYVFILFLVVGLLNIFVF